MWWKIVLIVLAVFVLITLIRAAFFKPRKTENIKIREAEIDENVLYSVS